MPHVVQRLRRQLCDGGRVWSDAATGARRGRGHSSLASPGGTHCLMHPVSEPGFRAGQEPAPGAASQPAHGHWSGSPGSYCRRVSAQLRPGSPCPIPSPVFLPGDPGLNDQHDRLAFTEHLLCMCPGLAGCLHPRELEDSM